MGQQISHPRCRTCKHWKSDEPIPDEPGSAERKCEMDAGVEVWMDDPYVGASVYTAPDHYCPHHEPREEDTDA